MTENPVRVVLVHRAGLFRAGLADLLARYADIAVVGQFDCDDAVATRAGTLQPDVVLLDCQPPDLDSVEAMRRLRAEHPRVAIAVLTASEDEEDLFAAVRAGARGYLLKSVELGTLHAAILTLAAGGSVIDPHLTTRLLDEFARGIARAPKLPPEVQLLTVRERQVLDLLAQGSSNHEIAQRLAVADSTVKVHLRNILGKLPVRNRQHAVAFAMGMEKAAT